jgi:hypothetical protein
LRSYLCEAANVLLTHVAVGPRIQYAQLLVGGAAFKQIIGEIALAGERKRAGGRF